MRYLAAIAGVVLGIFLLTESAHAMSCSRPTPAQHIDNSDIIFYGEVVRRQRLPKKNAQGEVEFKVLRAYKGVQQDTVRIQYYNDAGDSHGWGFRTDQPTLIFAKIKPEAEGDRNVGHLNYCDMIKYHARTKLHPEYWDILARLKPQVPSEGAETTAER